MYITAITTVVTGIPGGEKRGGWQPSPAVMRRPSLIEEGNEPVPERFRTIRHPRKRFAAPGREVFQAFM
jgi:hypothetical protein